MSGVVAGSPPASREHSKVLTFTVREISESSHALTAGVSASFHTASSVFSSVLITIYQTRFRTVEDSGDGDNCFPTPSDMPLVGGWEEGHFGEGQLYQLGHKRSCETPLLGSNEEH